MSFVDKFIQCVPHSKSPLHIGLHEASHDVNFPSYEDMLQNCTYMIANVFCLQGDATNSMHAPRGLHSLRHEKMCEKMTLKKHNTGLIYIVLGLYSFHE